MGRGGNMGMIGGLLQTALKQEWKAAREAALSRLRSESYAHILGHEQAHQSAAGVYGGGIVIDYDRNGIAVSGHVPIHMPKLDPHNPEAAYSGYAAIRSAALAPSDPSGTDLAVA